MNAIGYIRVSTEEQAKHGVSLDLQIVKIKQYCELHNMDLCGIYGDPGISGKNTTGRPGVGAVIRMADKKRINAVIIYKLDRLGRSTMDLLDISLRFKKKNVGLHSITESIDTSSAMGEFFFTIIAAAAQMERKLIGERTSAAMQKKRDDKQRVSRHAPVGYQFLCGAVVEDPTEQSAMATAKMMRANGMSLGNISRALTDMGYRSRSGHPYGKNTVSKMIGGNNA